MDTNFLLAHDLGVIEVVIRLLAKLGDRCPAAALKDGTFSASKRLEQFATGRNSHNGRSSSGLDGEEYVRSSKPCSSRLLMFTAVDELRRFPL